MRPSDATPYDGPACRWCGRDVEADGALCEECAENAEERRGPETQRAFEALNDALLAERSGLVGTEA